MGDALQEERAANPHVADVDWGDLEAQVFEGSGMRVRFQGSGCTPAWTRDPTSCNMKHKLGNRTLVFEPSNLQEERAANPFLADVNCGDLEAQVGDTLQEECSSVNSCSKDRCLPHDPSV